MSSKYTMKIDSNIITHLGMNLYSNTPSVLSEIVANAWDADASEVKITITDDRIVIEDNGCGMTTEDINKKYLTIGYQRRDKSPRSEKYGREVMGRKGIGKLSAFSIAKNVYVMSQKNGEKNGFKLDIDAIMDHIKDGKEITTYEPPEINSDDIDLTHLSEEKTGSKIVLCNFKKRVNRTPDALRKNLARRFGILGEKYNFKVEINSSPVTLADRGYLNKIEFLWYYGEVEDIVGLCTKAIHKEQRDNEIKVMNEDTGIEEIYHLKGWIGTAITSTTLKEEDAHSVVVMVRGKLAQEDILDEFAEGGIYASYVTGEICADYLDLDKKEDITTSSRQNIITEDYRYTALKKWILQELKYIELNWSKMRKSEGYDKAMGNKSVKDWYEKLPEDYKMQAKELFGNLNKIGIEDAGDRRTLFQHALLGFENLRYKKNLKALEEFVDDPSKWSAIFTQTDDLEAALYHKIVTQRLDVIKVLQEKIEDSALEKVIQKHLYGHLWLLDPSWEMGSIPPSMEQSIKELFEDINKKLPDDVKNGRFDIKYQKAVGQHIIIELKRAKVDGKDYSVSHGSILDQLKKYKDGLEGYLKESGEAGSVRCICLMGKWPNGWNSKDHQTEEESLDKLGIRIMLYKELVANAEKMYGEFINAHKNAGATIELIRAMDNVEF